MRPSEPSPPLGDLPVPAQVSCAPLPDHGSTHSAAPQFQHVQRQLRQSSLQPTLHVPPFPAFLRLCLTVTWCYADFSYSILLPPGANEAPTAAYLKALQAMYYYLATLTLGDSGARSDYITCSQGYRPPPQAWPPCCTAADPLVHTPQHCSASTLTLSNTAQCSGVYSGGDSSG